MLLITCSNKNYKRLYDSYQIHITWPEVKSLNLPQDWGRLSNAKGQVEQLMLIILMIR